MQALQTRMRRNCVAAQRPCRQAVTCRAVQAPSHMSRRAALSGCAAATLLLLRSQEARAEPTQQTEQTATPAPNPALGPLAAANVADAAGVNTSGTAISDDNLLRIGAALVGQNSIHSLFFPQALPDVFDEPTFPQALPESRWTGVLQGVITGMTLAPTFGGNQASKKNALGVFSAFCAAGAVGHALVIKNDLVPEDKKGLAAGKSIFKGALAVLFANQALSK